MQIVTIGNVQCGGESPLLLIAGPCQIEGLDHALSCAESLAKMAADAGMGFVYKSSYDKANRTSAGAERGVGMDEGLEVLAEVKAQIGVPVLSDVHLPEQCAEYQKRAVSGAVGYETCCRKSYQCWQSKAVIDRARHVIWL